MTVTPVAVCRAMMRGTPLAVHLSRAYQPRFWKETEGGTLLRDRMSPTCGRNWSSIRRVLLEKLKPSDSC